MGTEKQRGATAVFEDGHTSTWVAAEGVKLSSEEVADFLRLVLMPKPVEVIPLPESEPELAESEPQ